MEIENMNPDKLTETGGVETDDSGKYEETEKRISAADLRGPSGLRVCSSVSAGKKAEKKAGD